MKPTLLKSAAAVLIGLATVLAFLGYRLSQPEADVAQSAPEAPREEVVSMPVHRAQLKVLAAARSLQAGDVLDAEALTTVVVEEAPDSALASAEALLGKRVYKPLAAGDILDASHLRPSSPLGERLEAHERAVAIQVNETITAGGYVVPGDTVDVLLYVDHRDVGKPAAQTVLEKVRVLAIGDVLGETDEELEQRAQARTVVLAVPRERVSRLMLAEHAGRLRLAVRPREAQEQALELVTTADGRDAADHVTVDALKPRPVRRDYGTNVTVYNGDGRSVVRVR